MWAAATQVFQILKQIFNEVREDDIMGLSAEVAFRLIFALPPLVIFFASLSSVVSRYTGVDVYQFLLDQLAEAAIPVSVKETLALVLNAAMENSEPTLLSFGIVVAIWSASGAFSSMIKAFNRAYDVKETRNIVKRKLVALGFTLGLSVLIILSFVLFVFGGRLGQWVADAIGRGEAFATVWALIRWPSVVVAMMIALAILYSTGPSIDRPFRWISPGAVIALLLWLGATWGFSIYLQFADVGSAYGTLSTLVVLLFFLYVSAIVLLVGAEVNAVIDKHRAEGVSPDRGPKVAHESRHVTAVRGPRLVTHASDTARSMRSGGRTAARALGNMSGVAIGAVLATLTLILLGRRSDEEA